MINSFIGRQQTIARLVKNLSNRQWSVLLIGSMLCAISLGIATTYLGISILVIPILVFFLILKPEILLIVLLFAWITDVTWINDNLRFVKDYLILLIFAKSLLVKASISEFIKSPISKGIIFFIIIIVVGGILNSSELSPLTMVYGLRGIFLYPLLFFALLRLNFPTSVYYRLVKLIPFLALIQLPVQLLQKTTGFQWGNPANLVKITTWDNTAGLFGGNGVLVLSALLLVAAGISASEIAHKKRIVLNLLVLLVVPISLAIAEGKYGLLIYLPIVLWAFRSLLKSINKILIFLILGTGIVLVAWYAISNLSTLSGSSYNSLTDPSRLMVLVNNQFSDQPSSGSWFTTGRIGVLIIVSHERAHSLDGFLQNIFGNGAGSGSLSKITLFSGYLANKYPFDPLTRTDLSRLWIEFGWLGCLVFAYFYFFMFTRAVKLRSNIQSEDDIALQYITVSVIPIVILLVPYTEVNALGIAGFVLWTLSAWTESKLIKL